MSIDRLELCGLLVDYCDVLSAFWTLILTMILQNFSKSVQMKKKKLIFNGPRVSVFLANFNLGELRSRTTIFLCVV